MTVEVPTNEPSELRAGETWKWRRDDRTADYPASAWTLKYAFKNASSHIELTATADGAVFAVTVAAATTAAYTAGTYKWNAWVEGGSSEKYPFDSGTLEVLPKYDSATALDDRSHARIVLDAIEAVIEGRATKDQEEYTIGTRSLKHTPLADLVKFRGQYKAEVQREVLEEAARNGKGGGKLVVRF